MSYARKAGMPMQGAKYPEPQMIGEEAECKRLEPERDKPQVAQSLDQLRQTTEMVGDSVSRLEERLECILAPNSPQLKETRDKEKSGRVQLAVSLDLMQEQLADCCSRLVGMLQRLEI